MKTKTKKKLCKKNLPHPKKKQNRLQKNTHSKPLNEDKHKTFFFKKKSLKQKDQTSCKTSKTACNQKKHKTHCQKKQTEKTMLEKKLSQKNRKKKRQNHWQKKKLAKKRNRVKNK